MKCAFIISPSYSGSTLLSVLLAHHPDLITLGEFLDNRHRRYREGEGDFCSCGERLASCPYMADFSQRVRDQGLQFSVDFPDTAFRCADKLADRVLKAAVRPPLFEIIRRAAIWAVPAARHAVQRIVERNQQVISTMLAKEGAQVYLDSAKNNARVLYFHRYAVEMDVKVIRLIRDGRGVVNSIMKHKGDDLETAILRWASYQNSLTNLVRMLPTENILVMKYEDLCVEPRKWLEKTCVFLGMDPSGLPDAFGGTELHLTGNSMRLRELGEIRLDEKWKSVLSPEDLELFEKIGGELNREQGYVPV